MPGMPNRQTPPQASLFDSPNATAAVSVADAAAPDATASVDAAPLPLPEFLTAPPAPPLRTSKARVPWWARVLGAVLYPWLLLDIAADPGEEHHSPIVTVAIWLLSIV